MRKVFVYFLVSCLLMGMFVTNVFADDYDFENNEDMYYQMCSKPGLSDSDKAVCKLFQTYLNEKVGERQEIVDAANKELASIKNNLNKVLEKIEEFDKLIASIEKEQAALENQIKEIESNIELLELEIEQRQLRIQEIDEQLQLRLYNMQGMLSMNKYIEYLMGASDFADLIRRTSALNQLMNYDINQIKLLEDEKAKLEADILALEEQKVALEEQKALYETTRKTYESARKTQMELRAVYLAQQAKIEADNRDLQAELNEIKNQMQNIANNINYIPPSSGWIYPIKESFYISAGAWYYPKSFGGGMHLAIGSRDQA